MFPLVKNAALTCRKRRSFSAPGGNRELLGETARLKLCRLSPPGGGAEDARRESKLTLQLDEPSNGGQEPSGQSAGSRAADCRCWASYSLSCHKKKWKVETEVMASMVYRVAERTLRHLLHAIVVTKCQPHKVLRIKRRTHSLPCGFSSKLNQQTLCILLCIPKRTSMSPLLHQNSSFTVQL